MKFGLALQLGRISNLPTVWSNVLVGVLLAGAGLADGRLPLLMLAFSFFYVGGMFLNDAFDRDFDARHRPERPIPSGQVSAAEVFVFGFGMLALGLVAVAVASRGADGTPDQRALAAALALGGTVVFYDAHHKNNPLGPLLMGLCRVLVVFGAAFAIVAAPPPAVGLAALALLCHLIGLTYIAKQEHLERLGALWPLAFFALPLLYGVWLALDVPLVLLLLLAYAGVLVFAWRLLRRRAPGDLPRAVVTLIAGMSVLDAMVLAGGGHWAAATLALAAFALTLALQRWVSGT